MSKTYVILRRVKSNDYIFIMSEDDAKVSNWIDENGNRVWFKPVEQENCPTFVWEFDSVSKANAFYDALSNEIGIDVCHEEIQRKPRRDYMK